jgi:hypothetical protein
MRRALSICCGIVVASAICFGTSATPASASIPVETPACAAPIDHSIKLGADVGSEGSPCPSDGLDVTKDGVTINLNHHTVWGATVGAGLTTNAFKHVHFTNGYVRGFFDGVRIVGASQFVTVDHLFVSGPSHAGVVVTGDHLTIASNTLDGDQRLGIYGGPVTHATITGNNISGDGLGGIALLAGSDHAVIEHNKVEGDTGDGINVIGDDAQIEKNNVQGNGGWGVNLNGDNNHVTKNTVNANTNGGVIAVGDAPRFVKNKLTGNGWNPSAHGLAIDASGAAAPGGSGNVARDSGDPQECDPTIIC